MLRTRTRVGIAGFGFVGRNVYQRIVGDPGLGLDIAFVWNRSPDKFADLPMAHRLDDLAGFTEREPDLVVELAHPAITREHGASFLEVADYLLLSVSALVDDALETRLQQSASANGTRLLIPHGALVGVDNLYEGRANWSEVTITPSRNIRARSTSPRPTSTAAPSPGARRCSTARPATSAGSSRGTSTRWSPAPWRRSGSTDAAPA